MPPSKGERHWLLTENDTLLSWIPHLDTYMPCCNNKTPGNGELTKLLEVCPFIETINLALTVMNYLEDCDKVGWNDKTLLASLLSLLKQHKQDLHTRLSIKKNDLFSFFKALTQVCTQTQEVTACRDYLGKFFRPPGQTFADCLTIFESVYGHWQQLLRPVNRTELQDLSILTLKQITPFLVSDKCSKLFTSWSEQLFHYQITFKKITYWMS